MTKSSSSSSSRSRSSSRRRSSRSKPQPTLWQRLSRDQKLDILGWLLLVLSALTILSMLSAQQGVLTQWWISLLSQIFGWGRYLVPLFFGAFGLWLVLRHFGDRIPTLKPAQIIGVVLGFFFALTTLHFIARRIWPAVDLYALGREGIGGGVLGALLLTAGSNWLGPAGMILTLIIGWIVVITLSASVSPAEAVQQILEWRDKQRARAAQKAAKVSQKDISQKPIPSEILGPEAMEDERGEAVVLGGRGLEEPGTGRAEPKINVASRPGNGEFKISPLEVGRQTWRLPAVMDILEEGSEQYYSEDLIRKQVRIIEETLASFGAPVSVSEINQGPVVTQFGAEPLFISNRSGKKTKVKVSKIASLADDLSLALSARSIRIQAPIPGKGLVGIEVPNEEAAVVSLRDVMDSDSFSRLKGRLRLGLGQDVSGQAVAADLRAMPHLLIAGATGAGKSVCVNSVITAFLLQNSPDTLRVIMVDPKRVELTQYNGIPHLLAPVINDVERVVPTLRWVLKEMDSRYRRFANAGARNIDDYNRRMRKSHTGGSTGMTESPIPYIAVLIDELADVMMQAPDEAERVICRLAQMARATGIHLIIATQRPSVDVVTGLIKANFPARIAFAVASAVDSRVILDMPGAERLLGRGDMLFMPPDVSQPLRLQGAFVSDGEINRLIKYWTTAVEPTAGEETHPLATDALAVEDIATQPPLFPTFDEPTSSEYEFGDELLPAAVEIFLAENRCSTSLLQRRLRIGYTRAARLMDNLTDMGIVAEEMKGQSRKVNRAVAEELLRSVNTGGSAAADNPPF
ncbi:MAG: DNA translocase FtsK 4TM domain-containing protein [Anaerolineae bacterium]|nr:DNA translocase FtsK 4TM domain-containing protein [Anaerolineae bacterium]